MRTRTPQIVVDEHRMDAMDRKGIQDCGVLLAAIIRDEHCTAILAPTAVLVVRTILGRRFAAANGVGGKS